MAELDDPGDVKHVVETAVSGAGQTFSRAATPWPDISQATNEVHLWRPTLVQAAPQGADPER